MMGGIGPPSLSLESHLMGGNGPQLGLTGGPLVLLFLPSKNEEQLLVAGSLDDSATTPCEHAKRDNLTAAIPCITSHHSRFCKSRSCAVSSDVLSFPVG